MENLQQPAYPAKKLGESLTKDGEQVIWDCPGFTKLELASLMIAQGMLSGPHKWTDDPIKSLAVTSVKMATAVLEECNK